MVASNQQQTKNEKMLLDEDVRRWYENLSRRSRITAEINLRRLSLFCESHGLSPQALVKLAKKKRKDVEDLTMDYVTGASAYFVRPMFRARQG